MTRLPPPGVAADTSSRLTNTRYSNSYSKDKHVARYASTDIIRKQQPWKKIHFRFDYTGYAGKHNGSASAHKQTQYTKYMKVLFTRIRQQTAPLSLHSGEVSPQARLTKTAQAYANMNTHKRTQTHTRLYIHSYTLFDQGTSSSSRGAGGIMIKKWQEKLFNPLQFK